MKWIYVCLVVVVVLLNIVGAQVQVMKKPGLKKPKPAPKRVKTTQQVRDPIRLSPTTAPFSLCEVEDQVKIQCGLEDISNSDCNAINCCWDGQMCYYGRSVTLQCTKDAQIILVVARDATLPNIDTGSITLLGDEQGCQTVAVNSAFAIYQFPVTACGTIMTEEPGVITYENRMSSPYEVAVGPRGAITRDSTFELVVQCKYTASSIEALVLDVDIILVEDVFSNGTSNVELRLANGQCAVKGCNKEQMVYRSFYTEYEYPVTKVLRDAVYIDVHMLERTDPNLFLTLRHCWATTNDDPLSLPQWDLIVDGCPSSNDRYVTKLVQMGTYVEFPSHHSRFAFKMFTFVDENTMSQMKEKVFIHCDTAVCLENCAPQCNRKRRSDSMKSQSQETVRVSSFELCFVKQ